MTEPNRQNLQPADSPLPCPWCGKYPELNKMYGNWVVSCLYQPCFMKPTTGGCDSQEIAINRWNQRANPITEEYDESQKS